MHPTAADRAELSLAELPPLVVTLLTAEQASPRLVAHLTLVHDTALRLCRRLHKTWPRLAVDSAAIAFGAATHDIGKARIPAELSAPGTLHEAEGERLLLDHGIDPALARFARTHGAWAEATDMPLEDLLVVLADTAWKAKRSKALDDALAGAVAGATGNAPWDAFMKLDAIIDVIAATADDRLAWQGRFTVH
jgi:hypothetical protein